MSQQTNKLSVKTKLGYGVASIGDAVMYSIMLVFLIYYLTAVAHVDPGTAGTISSVALFISAISTIFIGYFSDNSRSKKGRRRPFVMVALPFIVVSFIAVFSNLGLSGTAAVIYYGLFAIIFNVAYCAFFVPYTALGAEITSDYGERASIRAYAAVGTQSGNFIATVLPMVFVMFFIGLGQSESMSWSISAMIFMAITAATLIAMLIATKGKELVIEHDKDEKRPNIFKDYFDVLRAKPTKYILLAIIGFAIVNSVYASNITFFVIYKLQLPESIVSTIFMIIFLVAIPMAPVINFVTQKIDKKKSFILFFFISAALLVIFYFVGINSWTVLACASVAYIIANAAYWQLISATIYDIAEIVELKTGKRSEGTLSSLQSVTQQIGAAVAMLIFGWTLQWAGFDESAATQSAAANSAIEFLQTLAPAIGLVFAALMMALFPITKKNYTLLQNALEEKKQSGTYSKDGLEKLL